MAKLTRLDSRLPRTASRLLAAGNLGVEATLRRETPGTPDANQVVQVTSEEYAVTTAPLSGMEMLEPGAALEEAEFVAIVPAESVPASMGDPKVGDAMTINSKEYSILEVKPISSGTLVVVWVLQLKRTGV